MDTPNRAQRRHGWSGLGGIFAICFALGCASKPVPPATPEATVRAFARALNQAKYDAAYALMSADYRKRVSLSQFKTKLSENAQETLAASNALSHIHGSKEEATVRYEDDQSLRLVRDGKRWYLATNVVDFYDQSTPRAALLSFVRALQRKRYDVVMRLIPSADKEGITTTRMEEAWSGQEREEVERLLSNLREHTDAPIEVLGDHATMPYGGHMRVQFVREGAHWKIADPE